MRRAAGLILPFWLTGSAPARAQAGDAASPITIGIAGIPIDHDARIIRLAERLAALGVTAATPLPEHTEWGVMQRRANAAIGFDRLDRFVRAFQARGFTDLVIHLRSQNRWASDLAQYAAWIAAVVERYDGDGEKDMRGLRGAVRYYELGVDTLADRHRETLEAGQAAARQTYPNVVFTPSVPAIPPLGDPGPPPPNADPATARWTWLQAAENLVKRVVIAADRKADLVTAAAVEDVLDPAGGERRPGFHALARLTGALRGARAVRRIPTGDSTLHVYAVDRPGGRCWIAWLDPRRAVLPEESIPTRPLTLPVGALGVVVQPLVTAADQADAGRFAVAAGDSRVTLPVTPTPLLIRAAGLP